MIKTFFSWLDRHPDSYWGIALGPTLLLLGWIAVLAWRESRETTPQPATPSVRAGWADAAVLFLFLLAWRWPFLFVADEFNPDESQLIAGALKLTHDPVFWRSVDGTTSGPLNFYALLPLHWLGLPLDYFSARLTGLLLITGALTACLRALAGSCGRAAAWLGVLPAAAFFATVTHPDLIHYSSEHVPLLLVAVSFWLLAVRPPADRIRLWTALFIAGSAPWAKLQTVPLALVLIGWGAWQVLRAPDAPLPGRLRRATGAALAALAPTFLAAVLLTATGQMEHAVRRYFVHNLSYVALDTGRTTGTALREMMRAAMLDGRFPLLLLAAAGLLLASTVFQLVCRKRPPNLLWAATGLMLAAAFAVVTPHREFLHYVLLLPVPLTLLLGGAVGGWWAGLASRGSRRGLACLLLATGGLLPLVTRCQQPLPVICGNFSYHWRHPREAIAMLVQALAGHEGYLGTWGWACRLHVETGLPPATRDTHSQWSIIPTAQLDYHRAVYLADLRQKRPAVFVDAVGPGAFAFEHRSLQAHENFPELAAYVRENYTLVRDLGEARIYARRGLPALEEMNALKIDHLLAQGRRNDRHNVIQPPIVPLDSLPRRDIGGKSVIMMLPPTLVEWRLDQDVRQVMLEFGFDPEAYERGASNGANVILELVSLGQARPVYRRFLDPARQSGDRGRQSVRVTLPPFSPGTHLVLRTDAGPFGDNAWDWVYLAGLQFRRSSGFLPEQFPGFNRVPDAADAENSSLVDGEGGLQLLMHAPAVLTYALRGGEHRLQFDYGFRPGAYSDGGHTDGAGFRVELRRAGRPATILFERLLNPVRNSSDQGGQRLDLVLPAAQEGDRLLISIDPGPAGSAAWDWTYLNNLKLD